MGIVTYAAICGEIKTIFDSLVASGDLARSYNYDELPESHNEMPAAETYFQSASNERVTFGAVVRSFRVEIRTDLYVTKRSNSAQDWQKVIDLIDVVEPVIIANQDLEGLDVKLVEWRIERVVLERASQLYAGARVIWTVVVF